MSTQWTKEQISDLIRRSDVAAMRAICAIFRRQTEDEKSTETTRHDNGVGFSQAHAKIGTELAMWMTKGIDDGVMRRRVAGSFPKKWTFAGKKENGKNKWERNDSRYAGRDRVEVCREVALRYAGQLTAIANSGGMA